MTLEDALAEATKNARVCPAPAAWMHLYLTLPVGGEGPKPGLPLILAPAAQQSLRLREHLEWAAAHGGLDAAADFLRALPEDKWIHAASEPE
jgi:hypothetical protein